MSHTLKGLLGCHRCIFCVVARLLVVSHPRRSAWLPPGWGCWGRLERPSKSVVLHSIGLCGGCPLDFSLVRLVNTALLGQSVGSINLRSLQRVVLAEDCAAVYGNGARLLSVRRPSSRFGVFSRARARGRSLAVMECAGWCWGGVCVLSSGLSHLPPVLDQSTCLSTHRQRCACAMWIMSVSALA